MNTALDKGGNVAGAFVLAFRRVLKAAVGDGTQQLRFQQQIREVGRVHADVVASGNAR